MFDVCHGALAASLRRMVWRMARWEAGSSEEAVGLTLGRGSRYEEG